MNKIFNSDGFIWFVGVVENRDDPEKLGRCKVRVYGYHSESKVSLPTEDLPWSIPIQPIHSASMSGIGSAPVGPLPGTWVVGFFLDGADMQQPAFFGTIGTKSAPITYKKKEIKQEFANKDDGNLKDEFGLPVVDQQGFNLKAGRSEIKDFKISAISSTSTISTQFGVGVGNKQVGFISEYETSDDNDGARYGKYELSSFLPLKTFSGNSRTSHKGSPLNSFLVSSKFKKQFEGLTPGTDSFDSKWTELSTNDSISFERDQDQFIKRNYYDSMVSNLRRRGIDLTKFGPSVQSLAFTTSLQSGPVGGASIFVKSLEGKTKLNDKDVINIVSEYKINNSSTLYYNLNSSDLSKIDTDLSNEKDSLNNLIDF